MFVEDTSDCRNGVDIYGSGSGIYKLGESGEAQAMAKWINGFTSVEPVSPSWVVSSGVGPHGHVCHRYLLNILLRIPSHWQSPTCNTHNIIMLTKLQLHLSFINFKRLKTMEDCTNRPGL